MVLYYNGHCYTAKTVPVPKSHVKTSCSMHMMHKCVITKTGSVVQHTANRWQVCVTTLTQCPTYILLLLLLLLVLHPFNGLFSRTSWVSRHQKGTVNHSGFYWSNRWWGGSGISCTICTSFAPHSRQITMPVPHHSVFTDRMLFPLLNQQHQSTEGIFNCSKTFNSFQYVHHQLSGSWAYC